MRAVIKIIATFLFIGYLPILSGSLSALAALLIYYLIKGNILNYALVTTSSIILGFLVSGKAENIFKKKDAPQIVIDDACGMLVALVSIPQKLNFIIAAFVLYRLLDIIKPPPIRRLEHLKGSPGVMLDDLAAGIYTGLILQTIYYLPNAIY